MWFYLVVHSCTYNIKKYVKIVRSPTLYNNNNNNTTNNNNNNNIINLYFRVYKRLLCSLLDSVKTTARFKGVRCCRQVAVETVCPTQLYYPKPVG